MVPFSLRRPNSTPLAWTPIELPSNPRAWTYRAFRPDGAEAAPQEQFIFKFWGHAFFLETFRPAISFSQALCPQGGHKVFLLPRRLQPMPRRTVEIHVH